ISITFQRPARCGDPVLELLDAGHCYGSLRVLAHVHLTVRRGDRIAVVGLNGAGKTTLRKLLAGELPLREGALRCGANVRPSDFAQHHADVLDPDRTVLEEVWRAAPELSQSQARGLCGAFLFSGDEVEKRIGVLSGGEKTRVALARLLAAPGNLLLLDEPTNHLDTGSAELLTESLLTYRGTMLFVSHNLDFARRLSNKVWDVRDGGVLEYPGALPDYLERWSEIQDRLAAEANGPPPRQAPAEKEARIKDRQELQARRRERTRLARRVAALEAQVEELERETARLERELADPAVYQDRPRAEDLARRFLDGRRELARMLAEWEGSCAELEALPEE
ncbi:MAG: ABC-F family ATP-binding cassette domain-containing protein, partial [Planctomycetes bacterium]|nr:ABC-F family ATP-binding cassette domain-containing protein [Planctomycetota bacterium]